jgi:CDP-diacylglycerol---glycerol-3-phosphate 3-phosphatidyltransferase
MTRLAGVTFQRSSLGHVQRLDSKGIVRRTIGTGLAITCSSVEGAPVMPFEWTPNKVTLLRVAVGFAAVSLFGRGAWANLLAVGLTVAAIALDALDGHIARKKKMATPMGAQLDILGDRMIENVYFTYFAVVGMVSLWLPILFFARGAATDFLRGLALKAGHSGWGANAMLQTWWGRALVASRWSRGLYAAMKCLCFCYLGLELALTRGPIALVSGLGGDASAAIRTGAQVLTWATAVFCLVRGLPVLVEGWKYFAGSVRQSRAAKHASHDSIRDARTAAQEAV